MGAVSIATGASADYYEREVAEAREAAIERGYYSKAVLAGEPEGLLLGLGLERLGLTAGDEVTPAVSSTLFAKLQNPATGEQLGRAQSAYASPADLVLRAAAKAGVRVAPDALEAAQLDTSKAGLTRAQAMALVAEAPGVTADEVRAVGVAATKATKRNVNFYDTCFTSDKSVSVAHAAADAAGNSRVGDVFEEALKVASAAAVALIDDALAYTRVGTHGKEAAGRTTGRYAKAEGVAVAVYRHHTSRDGDMHDHFHATVLNRAMDETGKYHALDGSMLYNSVPLIAAVASRAQELTISAELGLRWEKNPDGSRRLAAVDRDTCESFSKRGAAIEARLDAWAREYLAAHGSEPSKKQRDAQHTRIQRSTRRAKPQHRVLREDEVARWATESDKRRGDSLSEAFEALRADAAAFSREPRNDEVIDHDGVVTEALDQLHKDRTSYTRAHLAAAIDKALPANLPEGMTIEQFRSLLDDLTDQAVARTGVERLTPVGIIDRQVPSGMVTASGRSVFSPPGDEVFGSVDQLARESYLVDKTRQVQAAPMDAETAAATAEAAGLYSDQAAAFTSVLSSGRALEVLIGPAGTGKSFTVGKVAATWQEVVPHGQVIGLALSQAAAQVLKASGVEASFNLARWRVAQERISAGRPRRGDEAMVITPGALVVIDEAGMADTAAITEVVRAAEVVGAKVLLTGDHRQVAAVEAGGVMALLADDETLRREGAINELVAVWRFSEEWEREASLRLRDGDSAVLETYDRQGRIVEAESQTEAMELVYNSWLIDTLGGKTSIMVTATTEDAAALSSKARDELIGLGRVSDGASVELANGSLVSAGDVIQARANDRDITDQRGNAISNRDRLVVDEVRDDGTLWVSREGTNKRLTLPPAYVGESVELAYAVTAHGAQGRTVDSSYVLGSAAFSAETLYVALTRGRSMNRVVVSTALDDGGHSHAGDERPAMAQLADTIERSSVELSTTARRRQLVEASQSLTRIGLVWQEALAQLGAKDTRVRDAVAEVLGPDLMTRVDADPAAPAFWATVTLTMQAGTDPIDALRSTLESRSVRGATDAAALLTWRLTTKAHMAWEPGKLDGANGLELVPPSFLERTPPPASLLEDSLAPDYLGDYARRLAVAMDDRVAELGRRTAESAPSWAVRHLGAVPAAGTTAREGWEARAGRVAGYREQYVSGRAIDVEDPIGRAPNARSSPHQHAEWMLAIVALGLDANVMRDVSKLADDLLRQAIEEWVEAQELAPAYVRHEVDLAAKEALVVRGRAERELARAGDKPGPRTLALVAEAEAQERYVESLREMQHDRDEWFDRTALVRTTACEAEAELMRRHPDGELGIEQQAPEELSVVDLARYEQAAVQLQQRQEAAQQQRTLDSSMGIGLSFGSS